MICGCSIYGKRGEVCKMELTTLKNKIKSGDLKGCFIFTGPEIEVMRRYIGQMKLSRKAVVQNLTCITELGQKMYARSIIQSSNIYILRECKEFLSDESLQHRLFDGNPLGDDTVIFIYNSIDKRSKLWKNHQDAIVEFEYLKPEILKKYIKNLANLNDKNCGLLISACENDLGRILLELDKLQKFSEARQGSGATSTGLDENIEYLFRNGIIYVPPYDAVFDFVDAVLKNQPNRAFNLLHQSYASGEATMVLLSNLYNSARQLLQVQSYTGTGKITESTGLTPFQVKLASGRKNIYTNGEIIYLMDLVRSAEVGIKTGQVEDASAVESILVQFWG